jgi:hypothetical protein
MSVRRRLNPVEKCSMAAEDIKNHVRRPSIKIPRRSISRHEHSKSRHESSCK